MGEITEQDLKDFIKETFSSVRKEPAQMVLGLDFIKGIRKQEGDDGLYNFLCNVVVLCCDDAHDYLQKFIKEYKNKPTS